MNAQLTVLKRRLTTYWPLVLMLLAVFAAHIPNITAPPLDQHAWRQTDTAAVARNFVEESPNIFLPRIDMRGGFSGITGMEFPVYNYLIAGTDKVFGFANWHGRVISLLASLAGMVYFFGLVRRRYTATAAYIATAALALSPLWFYFTRNIQPDALMVSLSIAALYYAQTYRANRRFITLCAMITALSLACLVKLPAVVIALPILTILGWNTLRQAITLRSVAMTTLIFIIPNALWYWWSAHLSSHYGLGQYYYGDISPASSWALAKTTHFWHTLVSYSLPFKASTALIYLAIASGVAASWIKRDWFPFAWAAAIIIFLGAFASKSFYHNYYSLPLMPVIALFVGVGAVWIWGVLVKESRTVAIAFVVALFASSAWFLAHQVRPLYAQTNLELVGLEQQLNAVSSPQDRIVTNFGGNPMMLYFGHRKGWSVNDDQLTPATLAQLKQQGARFVVRDTPDPDPQTETWELPGATIVNMSPHIIIYRLQ